MNRRDILLPSHNFVIVGQQPWDTPIGSNCKDMARELSKNYKVLYINTPLDRSTQWRNEPKNKVHIENRLAVIQGKSEAIQEIQNNLYAYTPPIIIESINFLPDFWLYDLINKRNNKKIARHILKAIQIMGFNDFILFNDSDMFKSFYMKELLKPLVSVYYSRDNLITTKYFYKHGRRLEAALIEKSDVCVANSIFLKNYCLKFNKNSHYIGQGCDLELFDPTFDRNRPEDLIPIENKPIIGYVGALISARLDIVLLEFVAQKLPDYALVLIGPEDQDFRKSKLHAMENVYFLGSKSPDQLPEYINFFDVAINPQIVNDLTIGNYPRKIDEYLAMGKPTVATYTEAMEAFKSHVHLAHSHTEWVQLIQTAYKEKDSVELSQERISFAQSHSWENSVNEMLKAIADFSRNA
ncbi:MAG: glycosyltransferase [Cyclobacteriaceae bacterium]|nr:glycosyltransferase [Cyclobacteriaceae bacterium]